VPVITCVVLAAMLWSGGTPRRFGTVLLRHAAAGVVLCGHQRRLRLPIVLNLVLHWPGQFGYYLAYSSSKK